MKKQSILFVYVNYSTFVKADFEILSSFAKVTKYQFKPGKGLFHTFFQLTRQLIFLILNIWRFDSVFVWFADYHSLIPVLISGIFGKKSHVVIGGYDICRDRSLNYGAFCSLIRGFFTSWTIRICSVSITVSYYVDRKIQFVFPKVKHLMIHNCIHLPSPIKNLQVKEKLILCVALIDAKKTYLRKGIDTFLALSSRLPDYSFLLIGPNRIALSLFPDPLPANVMVYERLPHEELIDYFQKAAFYCQLSRVEIFGVALGEAMLNRCIPLVTNVGGMPEVIGKDGFIVPRDTKVISELILRLDNQEISSQREACRERILTHFNLEKRKEALIAAVNSFL